MTATGTRGAPLAAAVSCVSTLLWPLQEAENGGGFAYVPEGDFLGFLKKNTKSISFCVGHIYRVSLKIDQSQLKIFARGAFQRIID